MCATLAPAWHTTSRRSWAARLRPPSRLRWCLRLASRAWAGTFSRCPWLRLSRCCSSRRARTWSSRRRLLALGSCDCCDDPPLGTWPGGGSLFVPRNANAPLAAALLGNAAVSKCPANFDCLSQPNQSENATLLLSCRFRSVRGAYPFGIRGTAERVSRGALAPRHSRHHVRQTSYVPSKWTGDKHIANRIPALLPQ